MDSVPTEDNASSQLDRSKQPLLREEVGGGSDPPTTPMEEIQLAEGDTCSQETSCMATRDATNHEGSNGDTSNLEADAMEVEGEATMGYTKENCLQDDTVTCQGLVNEGCSTTGGCRDGEKGKTNAEKAVCESSPIKDAQTYSEGLTPDGSGIETGSEVKATPRDNTPIEAAEDTTPAAMVQGASSELQENGEPQADVGSSREVTPEVGVLTEAMLDEERRLREEYSSRESSVEFQELSELREQQRYNRLQHLLQKSSIYSKLLLERMETQLELKKKQEAHHGRGRKKKIIAEEQKSQEDPKSQEKPGKKRRGRKRKAQDDYQLVNYMNSQGHLKKRKVDSGEAVPSGGSSKTVEEEVQEDRYCKGELISSRQPKLMVGGVMRNYQLDGMEWVKVLYENGVNGILADEMGLGKTIQAISVIAYMIEQGVKGPFLVAAPLSTVPNWVAEFKKFTPDIPVVLYHGPKEEREVLRRKIFARGKKKTEELLPVLVTSYEICMRDQKYLFNRSWKYLVVDEGHRIKNLNCKLIRALKSYDAGNRLLLTGTPLQNNLSELWSLLNFILPDIFDDLNSFQSWFDFDAMQEDEVKEKIIAQEKEQHVLSMLHQILTPFLLRRLKTDVEFSLPPKKEVLVYAPLTAIQERYYMSLLDKTIVELVEADRKKKVKELGKENREQLAEEEEEDNEEGRRGRRRRSIRTSYAQVSDKEFESLLKGETALDDIVKPEKPKVEKKIVTSTTNIKMTNVWMMLRKCCNHPYLLEFPMTPDGQFRVDEEIVNGCGKIMLLDRMIPSLIKEGHKMLIFSQFTMMLDILEDYLDLRGLRYGRLDGAMAFSERQRQMTIFREDPDCYIFLLSTRAGGLGINLTVADTVIIYDSDWNPQADLQAQDRCHRIGQSKPVMVYRLVTGNTIDQRIVERAASKRRLEKMIIHKGKFKGHTAEEQQLSLDDLMDLFHSVDHEKVVNSKDAVISDEALAALLDRSQKDGSQVEEEDAGNSPKKSQHNEVFKVLEERDTHGKILHTADVKTGQQEDCNGAESSAMGCQNGVGSDPNVTEGVEPNHSTLNDSNAMDCDSVPNATESNDSHGMETQNGDEMIPEDMECWNGDKTSPEGTCTDEDKTSPGSREVQNGGETIPNGQNGATTSPDGTEGQNGATTSPHGTEDQNGATTSPDGTEDQNGATTSPDGTEDQNGATTSPDGTEDQNGATTSPDGTEDQNGATTSPDGTEGQNGATTSPDGTEGQNGATTSPDGTEDQNGATTSPDGTEDQNGATTSPRGTEDQNGATTSPDGTEDQNGATTSPDGTEDQNGATTSPDGTEDQNGATTSPDGTEGQNGATTSPDGTEDQNGATTSPRGTEDQNGATTSPDGTEDQNGATTSPHGTEDQNGAMDGLIGADTTKYQKGVDVQCCNGIISGHNMMEGVLADQNAAELQNGTLSCTLNQNAADVDYSP